MAFPNRSEIERKLLQYIYEHGGREHKLRTQDVYTDLAEAFGLSQKERTVTLDEVHNDGLSQPKWNNEVQFARQNLVQDVTFTDCI